MTLYWITISILFSTILIVFILTEIDNVQREKKT